MGDPAKEVPRVIGKGAFPWYAPTGHIVFESIARPEGIWAMPLSSETLNVGEPFPVAANGLRPSVSNDGTLVYWEDRDEKPRLVEFDRRGNLLRTIGQPQVDLARPDLSPDGRRVAVWGEGRSIYLHEVDRPASRPLLIDQHNEIQPLWDPSGNRLAFSSNREGGRRNLYAKTVDRNDPPELLLSGPENYYASDWSADGLHILVTKAPGTEGSTDLWYLKLNESGQHSFKPFRTTQHSETDAAFSPDGRYVAFVSNDTGRLEVYVCSFPDCDVLQQVSVGGGMQVRWAKEGGSLYYAGANDALVEVTIRTQPTLSVGEVQPLFTFAGIFNPQRLSKIYDVSDDGQRFVFSSPGAKKPGIIHVWQNWAAGFRSSESNP